MMDRKQTQDTIQKLMRQTREALRQLAEVEDISARDYVHVSNAQQTFSEHMQLLIQLKEEVMNSDSSPSPVAVCQYTSEEIDTEKRTRGGQKQFYLLDNTKREAYTAEVRLLFAKHYDTTTRRFRLPDGTQVKAPLFLACIYDLDIKTGLAAPGAPVKDFADIVKEAAKDTPNFTTAYNTIQSVIKRWRTYIGAKGYGMLDLHLHIIQPTAVTCDSRSQYEADMEVYHRVETARK